MLQASNHDPGRDLHMLREANNVLFGKCIFIYKPTKLTLGEKKISRKLIRGGFLIGFIYLTIRMNDDGFDLFLQYMPGFMKKRKPEVVIRFSTQAELDDRLLAI